MSWIAKSSASLQWCTEFKGLDSNTADCICCIVGAILWFLKLWWLWLEHSWLAIVGSWQAVDHLIKSVALCLTVHLICDGLINTKALRVGEFPVCSLCSCFMGTRSTNTWYYQTEAIKAEGRFLLWTLWPECQYCYQLNDSHAHHERIMVCAEHLTLYKKVVS